MKFFYNNEKFRPIRRKDRILENEQSIELLKKSEYGFLNLGQTENGYAYGIPINYVYDENQNCLYFHCAPEGQKIDCLKNNNLVSLCVVGKTKPISNQFTTLYESSIIFGVADIYLSEDEKRKGLRLLIQKYSPMDSELGEKYMEKSFNRTFVFKIVIEHMTGKAKK